MMRRLLFGLILGLFISAVPQASALNEASCDVSAGLTQLEKGRLEDAEAALSRARFKAPDDPRILYDLGIVQYRKRDYEAAAKTWERAMPQADSALQADGFHNLGNARYRARSWTEAIAAYEQALAIQEDQLTRFNLEQARKRLQEDLEQQKKDEQNQKDQKQGDQKQDGQQKNQDQKGSDQKQGQDGQKQDGKDQQGKQDGQKNQDGKENNQNQSKDGQKPQDQQAGKDGQEKQQGKDQNSQQPKQSGASDTADPGKIGSATPEMGPDERERKDLAMKDGQDAPPPPQEISESAKAMKNKKMNPYLVERALKELEQREREIQLRYRQDPDQARRDEEMDPFMMDPDQLQRFFEQRGRQKAKPNQDSPDW